MQGGPRRGRSPITGPTLPHAAQASQTSPEGEIQCPQGRNNQKNSPRRAGGIARRAGVQTSPEGEIMCPQGRRNQSLSPCKPNRTARRPKKQQKGSKPLGLPPALFRKNLQPQSTTSPLQPPAIPAPGHGQEKATRPRQRPCQKAACQRAGRSRHQAPRAWKAPANPPD